MHHASTVSMVCYTKHALLYVRTYSRTPLLRPPSKSDWSGRKTGVVVHKGFDYFRTWIPAHVYLGLHTNSFVHTENVFRSALQNAGKCSDLSATVSSGTPALSLFHAVQRMPALAAFSNNNAVFFLDQYDNISISGLIKPRSENIVQIFW